MKGPSQPTNILKDPGSRGFSVGWYKKYNWLEYSESKDAGFFFLLKQPGRAQHFGYDVFNKTSWRDWKHAYKALPEHVDGVGSAHNKCVQKYGDFKNQRQSVQRVLNRASNTIGGIIPNSFNFYFTMFKISLKARRSFSWA